MTKREKLHQAIDELPDELLETALRELESFVPVSDDSKEPILSYLARNQFDGPPDLLENLDLYASGETKIDSKSHDSGMADK